MRRTSDLEQGNNSKQISPGSADRFALPFLAALFALVVLLYLSRAGETALLCTRLLFTLSAAVYVAARLLRQREEGWSWSGWAEAWRATKDCAASVAGYCRLNYKRTILRYHRFAPPVLAVLYALVVFLNLFGAGKTVLHCARLLLFVLSAFYTAVRLLPQRAKRWSWSARAEAWCAVKECAASAADYCRQNYTGVIYCVIIFLYGTALLFADGGKDDHYVSMVSLLAPALVPVAKVSEDSLGDRGTGSQEQRDKEFIN